MVKKSAADRKIDKQIEQAYYAHCQGMSIPIMRIREVFQTFRDSLSKGNTFEKATEDMVSFVKSIATASGHFRGSGTRVTVPARSR